MCVSWLIYMCNVCHSELYICVSWLELYICVCGLKWYTCVSWLNYMYVCRDSNDIYACRASNYICVCRDSFICVMRVTPMRDVTHSCAWHDSFMPATWLIHMCDMIHMRMPHVCEWQDSFTCVMWLIHKRFIHKHLPTPNFLYMTKHENTKNPENTAGKM